MIALTTDTRKMDTRFLGLGASIEANTIQEALEQGDLDWDVSKRPVLTTMAIPPYKEVGNPDLLTPNGTKQIEILRYHMAKLLKDPTDVITRAQVTELLEETEDTYIPHINEFSIVRDDINVPFGVLGRIYECLNNRECLAILEPLLEDGKVVIERAGYFNDGANCWVMARFPEEITIAGEILDQYMKISWSHDGTEKLSATFIAYIRSTNTQISPNVPGSQVSIEIRHTTNAKQRIELATKLLQKGANYFTALEDKLLELLNIPFTDTEMEEYLEALMPDTAKVKDTGKVTQAAKKRDEVLDIFQNSGHDIEGTKYAGFTALAKWCDHDKPTRVTGQDKAEGDESKLDLMRKEARVQSTWFKSGSARRMKDAAFKLIIK